MAERGGLFKTLVQVCLLRASPEALPFAPSITWGTTLLIVGLPLILFLFDTGAERQSAATGLSLMYALNTAAYVACFYALLRLRGLEVRLTKLWLALMGSSILIGIANTGLVLLAPEVVRPIILLLSGAWSFVVTLHIYSIGLEMGKVFSLGIILVVQLMSMFVATILLYAILGGEPLALEQLLSMGGSAKMG